MTRKLSRMDRRFVRVTVACVVFVLAQATRADGPAIINCPWNPPNGGDEFALRGFYSLGYAGTSLKQVQLPLSFPGPGTYQVSLTPSSGTFESMESEPQPLLSPDEHEGVDRVQR